MAEKRVKIWYDAEGDYLEVIFDQKPGYFRETANDQVMEKVDEAGNILGFSVLKLSALKKGSPRGCTMNREFTLTVLPPKDTEDFRVIAEFIAVLGKA